MDVVGVDAVEELDTFRFEFTEMETLFQTNTDRSSLISRYITYLTSTRDDEDAISMKETSIYRLTRFVEMLSSKKSYFVFNRIYSDMKQFDQLIELLKTYAELFNSLPKAKTAKIVRTMLDIVGEVKDENSIDTQIQLCHDIITWCINEKRTFLRQRIESKLSALLLLKKNPHEALSLLQRLLQELRKLDDKQMLTEVHLTEARAYQAIQNIPKAKAALTAARTSANSIYVAPLLQGELDEMSGNRLMIQE